MAASQPIHVVDSAGLLVFRRRRHRGSPAGEPEFLLLRSARDAGHWSPPKGHLESWDASLLDCAMRETREETGILAQRLRLIICPGHHWQQPPLVVSYAKSSPCQLKRLSLWPAELLDDDVTGDDTGRAVRLSEEHAEFAWCAVDEDDEAAGRWPVPGLAGVFLPAMRMARGMLMR